MPLVSDYINVNMIVEGAKAQQVGTSTILVFDPNVSFTDGRYYSIYSKADGMLEDYTIRVNGSYINPSSEVYKAASKLTKLRTFYVGGGIPDASNAINQAFIFSLNTDQEVVHKPYKIKILFKLNESETEEKTILYAPDSKPDNFEDVFNGIKSKLEASEYGNLFFFISDSNGFTIEARLNTFAVASMVSEDFIVTERKRVEGNSISRRLTSIYERSPFSALITTERNIETINEIALWCGWDVLFCVSGKDENDLHPQNPGVGGSLTGKYSSTMYITYSKYEGYIEASLFNEKLPTPPGQTQWNYTSMEGVDTDEISTSELEIARKKNINVYTKTAGLHMLNDGVSTIGQAFDDVRGTAWAKGYIATRLLNLFASPLPEDKIHFDPDGYSRLLIELEDIALELTRYVYRAIDWNMPDLETFMSLSDMSRVLRFINESTGIYKNKAERANLTFISRY